MAFLGENGLTRLWEHVSSAVNTLSNTVATKADKTHSHGISDVTDLPSSLDGKVDKVTGKVLSTNDYTTTEKNKLAGIDTGANKTTVDSSLSTTSTNPVQNKTISRLNSTLIPIGTSIASNVDLNTMDYIKVGNYYCSTNAAAKTLTNCPVEKAFMMQVYSPLSTTIDNESTSSWVYRLRRLTTLEGDIYQQFISSSSTAGTFTYGSWKKIIDVDDTVVNATNATNATQDASGNVITDTYETKAVVDEKISSVSSIIPTNLANGAKSGSLRGVGSTAESDDYSLGLNAMAVGTGTKASAGGAFACGISSTASNMASHAEGWTTTASGMYAHAEGNTTTASGQGSHSEGRACVASGVTSHAEGAETKASGSSSHAEGIGTIASTQATHSQGKYNVNDSAGTYAHIVGNGSSDSVRSNSHTLDWDGNAWYSGDVYVGSTSGVNKDSGSKKLATEEYVNSTFGGANVYPVGAIFISTNSTSPASLFGGTWTQLKDRFLLGAGDTYAAGSTGGSSTHTLTIDEIPAHTHTYNRDCTSVATTNDVASGSAWGTAQSNTGSAGGGKSHNNMPPYLTVYMWKRTA